MACAGLFVDDNLIGNKRALKTELLPALIAWQRHGRRGLPFYTEASINLADDKELMRLMAEAGFDGVFIGIETPEEPSLVECGKRQVEFIQNSGIVTAMVGLLNALPDTRLHARMKLEGRLAGNTTGNNVDGTLNFIPRMNTEALIEGYKSILRRIYAPAPYYQRVRTLLREIRRPKISAAFEWRHLWALGYSGLRLGVIGRERIQYWRLIFWTLFHRPMQMQLAVTLAIYGHHFRK